MEARFNTMGTQIKNMEFVLTDSCNLDCTYCHVKKGMYRMSKAQAEKHLQYVKENFDGYRAYSVSLFGGEPLLNWGTCTYIIDALKSFKSCDSITLFTNGILLTDSILDFCLSNGVQIQISFDAYHSDETRVPKNGVPCNLTYEMLLKKLAHTPGVRFAYTVSPQHARELAKVYKYYVDEHDVIPHIGIVKAPPHQGLKCFWDESTVLDLRDGHKELCEVYAQRLVERQESPTVPIIDYYVRRLISASAGYTLPASCAGLRISFYEDSMYHCLLQKQFPERKELIETRVRNREACKVCTINKVCDCGCMYGYIEENPIYCQLQHYLYANVIELMHNLKGVPQWNRIITKMVLDGANHESDLCPHCD